MKRRLLFAAIALTALAGCTEDSIVTQVTETPVENELKPISFSSSSAATTRADKTGADAATLLGNNFVVEGIKGDGSTTSVVFDHYNLNWIDNTAYTTTSNTSNWEYVGQTKHDHATIAAQTVKYWDYAASQYDFIAYSKGTAKAVYTGTPASDEVLYSKIDVSTMKGTNDAGVVQTNVANITKGAYTITGKSSELAKCYIADLKTIYRDKNSTNDALGDYNKVVLFKFRSLSSKVRLAIYETVPGYSVKDVVFYTDDNTTDAPTAPATWGKAHLYTKGTGNVFNEEGKYIVYYPTIGSSNKENEDYNKAHVKFVSTGTQNSKEFGTIDNATKVAKDLAETSSTDKLYLGRSSNEATYYGPTASNHYTVVIPNEAGSVLNLKCDYTLISTDGSSEIIKVTGATATVPAQYAQWKSGYAYTYIFKISENTPGKTNPEAGPAGLYPITFDALILDDETTGTQETITTVSEPSITTFGYDTTNKMYLKSSKDYPLGTTVYATVMKDGAVVNTTFMTDLHLYKLSLHNGATESYITEGAVAEAWEHPSGNNIGFTHVCTPLYNAGKAADVSKVPGEDGNEKTIDAVKFTPETTGYYAIQYRSTAGTYTALDPQPAVGAEASAYYYKSGSEYYKVGTADPNANYYTIIPSGTVLDNGTSLNNYYTTDGNGNYTKQTSGTADGTTTYYTIVETQDSSIEPGDNIIGVGYYTKDASDNYLMCTTKAVSGVTYYTTSTAPKYTYKVVQIH